MQRPLGPATGHGRAVFLLDDSEVAGGLVMLGLIPQPRREVAPGVVHVPGWLGEASQRDLVDALVNFYRGAARLGMHVDREELAPDPVVSLSLGAACVFRVGNTENRGRPYVDVVLESGDLIVFGRESRRVHHGVPRVLPERPVPPIGTVDGERINVTLRVSGL